MDYFAQPPRQGPSPTQYAGGYASYEDIRPESRYGSNDDGYRGFAGLATSAPQERAPWDAETRSQPAVPSAWDAGALYPPTEDDGRDRNYEQPAAGGLVSGRRAEKRRSRGPLAGAVSGLLAAALSLGVANLTAAFVRPQASPIIAIGDAFIDRTPPALRNFAIEKFGHNEKDMLLLGLYAAIALIALAIGLLACRRISVGVAGIWMFGMFGAFVAIMRPESHPIDVIPSIVGGIAGTAAIVWLIRTGALSRRSRTTWAGDNWYGPA